MEHYKSQILRFLSRRNYNPVKVHALANALGVEDTAYPAFKEAFEDLRRKGSVVVGNKNLVTLPAMTHRVVGTYRANPRGFGFVVPFEPNAHGDLYISHGENSGAMTGDTVVARPVKKGKRFGQMRYAGTIIEILERAHEQIVGTLKKYDFGWVVEADGSDYVEPITVQDVGAKNARPDDKVVVEITEYPNGARPGRGVIHEVLGRTGAYAAEIHSIMAQYKLPEEFPPGCVEQARRAATGFRPEAGDHRDDIRDEFILTIDPPDAKDFDDAISLKRNADGNWLLGIHIADVSHFVTMDSPLDIEAKERGNSVYLPGKVIPMLPEVLSNGVCSLQPGELRFAKTVYITYDNNANILQREYANSLIRSDARLTYQEAEEILRGKVHGVEPEVVALLKDMDTLAKAIEKRREKNGMLHLNLPEIDLEMDDSGKVVDAQPADDSYPHTIIEMFMVEANEAVASLLDRFGVPFMRRIHPEPDTLSLRPVAQFIRICGLKLPRVLDRGSIQSLLKMAQGKPYEYAINMYILRSMQKAEYSPAHIGHFALASTHYCHFTSPIRRYADLLIHRLMDCYVTGRLNKIGLEEVLPEQELVTIGRHITYTEQQSENAERELKTVLVLQMLSERIGEELDCVVSGLTNFGIFAQVVKFGIEGLIEFGDLGMDEWRYDDKVQAVVGQWSGKRVHLGQQLRVTIASVNVAARQLYLSPVESLVPNRGRIASTNGGRRNRKQKYTRSRSRR